MTRAEFNKTRTLLMTLSVWATIKRFIMCVYMRRDAAASNVFRSKGCSIKIIWELGSSALKYIARKINRNPNRVSAVQIRPPLPHQCSCRGMAIRRAKARNTHQLFLPSGTDSVSPTLATAGPSSVGFSVEGGAGCGSMGVGLRGPRFRPYAACNCAKNSTRSRSALSEAVSPKCSR